MRTSVLVGLVAGTALSMSAYAQDEHLLNPISLKGVTPRVVTPNFVVAGLPAVMRNVERGFPGIIYDRITTLDSYFWFGYLVAANNSDDISLSPGPQSGLYAPGGQLVTGMDLIFANEDLSGLGRSFDINVNFWNTMNPTGPDQWVAGDPCDVTAPGFFSTISALPAGFWIISWSLTGFPNGGILLQDDGLDVDVYYTEVGVAPPAGYPHISGLGNLANVYNSVSSFATTGNQVAATNIYGYSTPWFGYDANADGIMAPAERYRRADSPYIPCDLTINLYGDVRCPADFNNDGFTDPLDYNGFINAFETPCP
jgi:hypothetical protein